MDKGMPVFVKVDEYKDVLDLMKMVKGKLAEAHEVLGHLNELKNEEDAELESWKLNVEDIQKKIDFIDNALFEPEHY